MSPQTNRSRARVSAPKRPPRALSPAPKAKIGAETVKVAPTRAKLGPDQERIALAEAQFERSRLSTDASSVPVRPDCFHNWHHPSRQAIIAGDIVPVERKRCNTIPWEPSREALDAVPACATNVERVAYVTELMAAGLFRRGKTWHLLQEAWGISRAQIQQITAKASTVVKVALDPSVVMATLGETVDELLELAHECKDSTGSDGRPDATKEAIVAFRSAGDLCLALVKDSLSVGNEKQLSDREAHARLVALGWQPPQTLLGLPMPDVEVDEPAQGETDE